MDRQAFIQKTRAAAERCADLAREADALGLGTLAREWDYLGKALHTAIGRQEHTLNPDQEKLAEKLEFTPTREGAKQPWQPTLPATEAEHTR